VEAKEILDVSTLNAFHIFSLYKAEALQMTTSAISSGQEWPFFTLPMFEAEAELLINQTKTGQYLALHPLVAESQREQWEEYSVDNQGWVQDAYDFYGLQGKVSKICPFISQGLDSCDPEQKPADPYFAPLWQVAPAPGPNEQLINYNGFDWKYFERSFEVMSQANHEVLSEVVNLEEDATRWPESLLSTPVHQDIHNDSPIVAVLTAIMPWHDYFLNVLPVGSDGIVVVVNNDFQAFTYEIDGPEVHFLGPSDLHDPKYDHLEIVNDFAAFESSKGDFGYTVHVYPTDQFKEEHTTNHPVWYTCSVALVFVFTASVFLLYDCMVERRQNAVMRSAKKSNAIVSSLFPKNVRDRLMEDDSILRQYKSEKKHGNNPFSSSVVDAGHRKEDGPFGSRPIADLFPETTVMFADISGFTAWSSVREPSQVFILLESIYNAFDKIARRMQVFKVETIGDSYVAVTGLPEPRKDHAVVMARFAFKCLVKMSALVHNLDLTLGPGTADLKMRFGLHSGQVTGGVLRGEKSRFQLFGDTVNTAARMESTGLNNKIQMSKETRDLLIEGGKSDWVQPRETTVSAKGKGEMQTYWFTLGSSTGSTTSSSSPVEEVDGKEAVMLRHASQAVLSSHDSQMLSKCDSQTQRLILWNVENLLVPLKKMIALRAPKKSSSDYVSWHSLKITQGATLLDEVKAVIPLPQQPASNDASQDVDEVVIEDKVTKQLIDYVSTIASIYNKNPFHSFDHASHVTQSVTKLLSRVVTPNTIDFQEMRCARKSEPEAMHNFTYGITSDPLTQFAVVLSALVHDMDHPGVPNTQLIKEGTDIAKTYKNKSVAEQNSVNLAWDLLMEPTYEDLRRCIYSTEEELGRFRQLIINAVMATDVMDKELGALRKKRWDLAFKTGSEGRPYSSPDMGNRKATIVIEHMIQASDVCHTMQHWQIYIDWNEKFFDECYQAFLNGRAEKDPSLNWYEGELGFFDFYILPLAKKLKECGVFGVSGDEYLTYGRSNRDEWQRRGQAVVETYMEKYQIMK
jgi:class 3 adenylate cyclase